MKRLLLVIMLWLGACGMSWATVPLVPYTVTYTCTGGFGPFAFSYPISDPTALTVTLNGVLLASTSYTVVPVNNNYNNGGNVTLGGSFPCTSPYPLVIARSTPIDQLTQYYDNMPSLPMITGRSVDKLTEIAQELEGLIAQIGGGGGVSITGVSPIVVTPSPILGLGVISCPTCSVGGSVTSVSGTTSQIDVATGTTTPVISLDPALIFPGGITMGAHVVDFGAATSMRMPVFAGASAGTAGYIAYDSAGKSTHFQTNNFDSMAAAFASAPTGSLCVNTSGTSGLLTEVACPTGVGTVTSFSAGALSPLFTTSVATATTTPALTFTLSNFSADNIFGNFTGGVAAPSTQAIPACANDGVHALVYVAHVLTCETVTGSGGTVTSIATTAPITGGTITTTGTIACATCATETSPANGIARTTSASQNVVGTELSGAVTTSGSNVTALAASYRTRACEVVWGGSGTSFALQSGDDAIANQSCLNQIGVTETITGVYCRSDISSNTTTVNPTFGSTGTGTTICSGALTCGSSGAYSSTCTVSNGALTNGSNINPVMGGTLTGTSIHMLVTYTLP